nr:uncharacterized protein LOC129466759 [Symphalangus syndactylus]
MRNGGDGARGRGCGAPEAKAEAPRRRSWPLRIPAGYTQGRGQGRVAAWSGAKEARAGCPRANGSGGASLGRCSGRGVRSAAPGRERNLRSVAARLRPENGGGRGKRRRSREGEKEVGRRRSGEAAGGACGAQPQGRRGSRGDEEVRRRWQVPGLRRPGVSGSGRGPSKAPSSPAWANWEAVGCAPATLACVVENLESPTASELILGRLEAPRSFRERAGRCRDALLGRVQGGKRARPVGSCPRLCTCLLTWRTVAVESLRPGEGRGGAVAAHYLCPGSPEGSRSCQIKPPDPRENPEASVSVGFGVQLVLYGSLLRLRSRHTKISSYPSAVLSRHYTDTPPMTLLLQGNIYFKNTATVSSLVSF